MGQTDLVSLVLVAGGQAVTDVAASRLGGDHTAVAMGSQKTLLLSLHRSIADWRPLPSPAPMGELAQRVLGIS